MPDTHAIFFWMGGVLTQSIDPLLRAAFAACGQPEVNLLSASGFTHAGERLAIGQSDDIAFCQTVVEMIGTRISAEALREATLASFAPNPGVARSIGLLPESYTRWLIVDYPRSWFERVSGRLQIGSCFSGDHIFFLPESRLSRMVPDVFVALPQRAGFRPEQCLVFDANLHRAVAALDLGFPSALFVDAKRMEHEFRLRHITAQVPLEHRPPTILSDSNP